MLFVQHTYRDIFRKFLIHVASSITFRVYSTRSKSVPKMDANIFYVGGDAIKITFASRSLNTQEVKHLFGRFGKVKQVVSQDNFLMVYFDSEEEAQKCVERFQCEATISSPEADPASTGDSVAKDESPQKADKTKKSKKKFLKKMSQKIERRRDSDDVMSSPTVRQSKKDSGTIFDGRLLTEKDVYRYIHNCTSPVLLNTMDPGFRLAYCHDVVQNSKPVKQKPGCLNPLGESIKKYMDEAPRLSTQELVVTNLPPHFKENDVYELCGNIEPKAIELKKTSNINVLYANIRTNTDEDFDKLVKTLENCQINGVKVTTIPITKVENSVMGTSSWMGNEK